jgi:hypothetical protein
VREQVQVFESVGSTLLNSPNPFASLLDDAQAFSRLNPLLLWPRLPYDLTLIVDWIGQVHLYAFPKDAKLPQVRERLVHDSFDLETRLTDPDARASIVAALEMTEDEVPTPLQQLQADPAFVRLKQVREALAR